MALDAQKPVHWNLFGNARPQVGVIGIAYDRRGDFPTMFRSDKVRSAKNAWSIPSGLHEIGLTLEQQFGEELREELGLSAVPGTFENIGVYENIAHGDGWHWVMQLATVRIETLDTLVNKEPDKHPTIEKSNIFSLRSLIELRTWTPGLQDALRKYYPMIFSSVTRGMCE